MPTVNPNRNQLNDRLNPFRVCSVAVVLTLVLATTGIARQDNWTSRQVDVANDHSILERADQASEPQATANGIASIPSIPQTFTARPAEIQIGDVTVSGEQLKLPQTPDESTFRSPEKNALRAEPLASQPPSPPAGIDGDDRGTHALQQSNGFSLSDTPAPPQSLLAPQAAPLTSDGAVGSALPPAQPQSWQQGVASDPPNAASQPPQFEAPRVGQIRQPGNQPNMVLQPNGLRPNLPDPSAGQPRSLAPMQNSVGATSPASNPNELRTTSIIDDQPVNSQPHSQRMAQRETPIQPLRQSAPVSDRQVQPSGYQQEFDPGFSQAPSNFNPAATTPSAASNPAATPAVLKQQLEVARNGLARFTPQAQADLPGTPVQLEEMLLEPIAHDQRAAMVGQYWETWYDWSAYQIALEYQQWIQSVPSPAGADSSLLRAAQQAANDRVLAARIQLIKSQSQLQDYMPNPKPREFRPLPASTPLAAKFNTDIERYRQRGAVPTRLRGIAEVLGKTALLIAQRSGTVESVRMAKDQLQVIAAQRPGSLASLLAAGQLWQQTELELVASVVSYNQAIGEYVLTVEPGRSPSQLARFMIGSQGQTAPTTSTPQFRQATLPQVFR